MGEGEEGLKERGRNKLLLLKRGEGLFERGIWIEDFQYLFEDHKFISAHYNFQVLLSLSTVSTQLHTICNINFQLKVLASARMIKHCYVQSKRSRLN